MNTERKLALVYLILGLSMGFLSNYLKNNLYSFAIGIAVYGVSFFILRRFVGRDKTTQWYLGNTLVTFALIWLVAWIFAYNQ